MELIVRVADSSDAESIWKIRNEPASLAVAASPEIIPLANHIAWFENKYFQNKGSLCFIAELEGRVVGYSRFDIEGDHYLNSIAVSSSVHGKGIGTVLLSQSVAQVAPRKPIHAEVRKFNAVSIKLFERCGFKKISEDDNNIYYEKRPR